MDVYIYSIQHLSQLNVKEENDLSQRYVPEIN